MGRRAESPTVNFRQSKERVVASDDDVAVADQSDATTDTKTSHSRYHRNGTVVDGGESRVATFIGSE